MTVVLDASAALALLLDERGGARVAEASPDAVIGAVNLAEVLQRLAQRAVAPAAIDAADALFAGRVVPFTEALARDTAALTAETRPLGLSLGDRACLALARSLKAPVMTADRAWTALDVGVTVEVIR
jgi:PIN domain nuclease of toxin-antitoxin system